MGGAAAGSPFTIKGGKDMGTSEYKAEKLLDHLCGKALLVDSWDKGCGNS